jgi:adenine-specific DNA methylase
MKKNILIACEYSGIVRTQFEKYGHHVVSCDILDTEIITKNHYKGNIFDILYNDWDLLIAFPPCTYLSGAGLFRCNIENYGIEAVKRIKKRNEATNFFLDLYTAPIKHICIENPVGYINTNILKPSQIINPYYFGESDVKRTCLWLKNLPPLQHYPIDDLFNIQTHCIKPSPISINYNGKKRYFTDAKLRKAHDRNKTFLSIAKAMAEQWHNKI